MDTVLAIDQSTSATKALMLEPATCRVIRRASREHQQHFPSAGRVEHDANEIWRNTLAVIDDVLKRGERPACVSVTNQRETFVVFDRETGEPLAPAVVWQCTRGQGVCDELRSREEFVRSKTGLKLDSYFTAPKATMLLRERPEIRRRLEDGSAVLSTIDAYLVHRLTAGRVFATDASNASRTLLFDLDSGNWDESLCELFGVPIRALPEIRDSTANFGEMVLGPAKGVPIVGVMGDSQAALFGHRCFDPGEVKVTIGTGSSVMLNIGECRPKSVAAGTMSALAWRHAGTPTFGLEGIISYAAATLSWLRDQLGIIRDADEAEALAAGMSDSGGVFVVPAFNGLPAPHWRPAARAAIVGLTAHSGRAQIARAAIESIAFQIADVVDMLRNDAGIEPTSICVDGGATKNTFLMQLIADLAGVELIVPDVPDVSPVGVALAGAVGLGMVENIVAIRALPYAAHRFHPAKSRAEAQALRAGWNRAVKQVLAGL